MSKSENRTPIQLAAERLRAIVYAAEPGTLIGSEDALIAKLGYSRNTVRQVARLLEREGLLRVRRGINGGYFASRPDAGTIEATVATYLETLDMDASDVTILASALWVEVMRKAAAADPEEARAAVARLRAGLATLTRRASFDAVRRVELQVQDEMFALAASDYIKLIFDINIAFSRRRFTTPSLDDDGPEHLEFVARWIEAKQMELNAIEMGDADLAAMAGRYSRTLWHKRLGRRFAALGTPRG